MDTEEPSPSTRRWQDDEIDIDIRRLVGLLNQRPGIRTISSCAGHACGRGEIIDAYIYFVADDQATVRALIDVIPNWGTGATCTGFCVQVKHVGITLFHPQALPDVPPHALVYRLAIAGMPLYHQRAQIHAIEEALATVS